MSQIKTNIEFVKEEIKNNDESGAVTMCLQLLFMRFDMCPKTHLKFRFSLT